MYSGDDFYTSDPRMVLRHFLAAFDMWPDVRGQIEARFWQRKSLYHTIMGNKNAWERVKENVTYALEHQGNVATNVTGFPRIGKSTIARWLSREIFRIQFGDIENWQDKVLFARSYSRATQTLQLLTRELVDSGLNDDEVITALQGYCLIEDENQLEREKDSVKARTDMKTIAESCASSGIHLLFLSPSTRGFGYFTLWAVGINPKKNENLSFYLDNEGACHGYLVTPNVPAFDAYTKMKNRTVVQTLLDRGRVKAEVIKFEKEITKPDITIPPDADFLKVLELHARYHLATLNRKPATVNRWVERYFQGKTYKEIAEQEGDIRADSVGDSLRELDKVITRTMKGDILEDALCTYLNKRWGGLSSSTPSPPVLPNSSQDYWVRGWRGCDVSIPDCVVVNAKLKLEHRPSWTLDALPEVEVLPRAAFLLLVSLGPPGPVHQVYSATTPSVNTGSCEEVEWAKWLSKLSELFVNAVARGIEAKGLVDELVKDS